MKSMGIPKVRKSPDFSPHIYLGLKVSSFLSAPLGRTLLFKNLVTFGFVSKSATILAY